jgi:hypothetical protein
MLPNSAMLWDDAALSIRPATYAFSPIHIVPSLHLTPFKTTVILRDSMSTANDVGPTGALYNAIPQEAAHDIDEDAELEDLPLPVEDLSGRITSVHFALGCAVLLPWNGL